MQIFIPILDTVAKHWILAVVKVSYGDCEIWDSNPEVAAEQRRKDYVIAAVSFITLNSRFLLRCSLKYSATLSEVCINLCFQFLQYFINAMALNPLFVR